MAGYVAMPKKPPLKTPRSSAPDGKAMIRAVLEKTRPEVAAAKAKAETKAKASGEKSKFKPDLKFAMVFAKHMSAAIAAALRPKYPEIKSGENPSRSVRGMKRVDINYSTPEAGLGFALSFKSVHFGEREGGNVRFIHNMKRNDEELRVEATSHHLRQPYAVMAAVLFLPFESCEDMEKSSFASWVEYLWPLKGRDEPEDPPDRFELVFIGLYERDGSGLGFYEVGGGVPCPRKGRPKRLLELGDFLQRLVDTYNRRNGLDFFFEDEKPSY
jgi:hypothetical protein